MRAPHILLMLVVTLVWAFNFVAAKVGVSESPPVFFTAMRFVLLTGLLFWAVKPRPWSAMRIILPIAATNGALHFVFMFNGINLAEDMGPVAVAVQLAAPFSLMLSVVILKEQVGWRRWSGVVVAFVGVALIGFDPRVLGYLDAIALVIVAGFFMGLSNVLMRLAPRDVSPFEVQAWVGIVSAPTLALASWAMEDGQWAAVAAADWRLWGALVYSTVGASLFGHSVMFVLLQRYEVAKVTPWTLLTTPFAIGFGWWFLGDEVTWLMALGGALTVGGVMVIAIRSGSHVARPAVAAIAAQQESPPPR